MFSTKEFQSWIGTAAVPFAAVMTKIEGREHDELLRTYGFRGFPSMALLTADGEKITDRIARDLYSMKGVVAGAPLHHKLKAKMDAGEKVDQKDWFVARLNAGLIEATEARTELAGLNLKKDAKEAASQRIFVLEMSELLNADRARRREQRGTPEGQKDDPKVIAAVYAAFQEGHRLPEGCAPEAFVDDILVAEGAAKKDKAAFFHAHDRVKARLEAEISGLKARIASLAGQEDPQGRYARFIESTKARVEEAEARLQMLAATAEALKAQ